MAHDPHRTAFLFPVQGSQAVVMGKELASAFEIVHQIFAEAEESLGFQLSDLAWKGPDEALNDTVNTQPALFVHSIAALRVLQQLYPTLQLVFVAGHSMGELSALVAASALDFPHALQLVRTRGQLMKQAGEISPGGMAAILGLDIPVLENICLAASSSSEPVQVANDNCPGQVVISGAAPALERALALAEQAGARRAVRLAVSIAAHSPLMAHAQTAFNQAVSTAPIIDPEIPIIGNVTAIPLKKASQVRSDLRTRLNSRVRWTESIHFLLAQAVTPI